MSIDQSMFKVPTADRATCFLCGTECDASTLTQEHVFAKWLQGKYGLWDRTVVLLNSTTITYRNLRIPACAACNGGPLAELEKQIAAALDLGASEVRSMGHERLFLWAAKLFFGILYAEALLPINRAARNEGPIIPQSVLEGFKFLHFLMQGARSKVAFSGSETPFHASVLVFPIQEHPNPAHRFMYRDDAEYGIIAIRLNTVGLIVAMDGGAQENIANEVFHKLYGHQLHPLQFEELSAKVFAKARSLTRTPKFIVSKGPDGVTVHQLPLGGLSEAPIFLESDRDHYAHLLAEFTAHPLEAIRQEGRGIQTWIRGFDKPAFIDIREFPWP